MHLFITALLLTQCAQAMPEKVGAIVSSPTFSTAAFHHSQNSNIIWVVSTHSLEGGVDQGGLHEKTPILLCLIPKEARGSDGAIAKAQAGLEAATAEDRAAAAHLQVRGSSDGVRGILFFPTKSISKDEKRNCNRVSWECFLLRIFF